MNSQRNEIAKMNNPSLTLQNDLAKWKEWLKWKGAAIMPAKWNWKKKLEWNESAKWKL